MENGTVQGRSRRPSEGPPRSALRSDELQETKVGVPQGREARRQRLQALAAHFSGRFDSLLARIPFDALTAAGDEENPEAEEATGAPETPRGIKKRRLRQQRYHPRVLVSTPLRLQARVALEEMRKPRRQAAGPQRRSATLNDPSSSREELQKRLQAKLAAVRHSKPAGGDLKKRKKGLKARKPHKRPAAERNGPSHNAAGAPAFEFAAVTHPAERVEAPQASRAGAKRRRLQTAIREIEERREAVQKCGSPAEQRRLQLQQSVEKVMKKLDGEKVMDDVKRLKKKRKLLDKKKTKAREQWRSRLQEADERRKETLQAKKQAKEERRRERGKRAN